MLVYLVILYLDSPPQLGTTKWIINVEKFFLDPWVGGSVDWSIVL